MKIEINENTNRKTGKIDLTYRIRNAEDLREVANFLDSVDWIEKPALLLEMSGAINIVGFVYEETDEEYRDRICNIIDRLETTALTLRKSRNKR